MELIWTAWLLGLVGSLHCAGMCGPLALALPVPPGGPGRYLLGRALYNGGRVVTYAVMGALFGWLGRAFVLVGVQQYVSLGLGLLLLLGLVLTPRFAAWAPLVRLVRRLKEGIGGQLKRRTLLALSVLGFLNGLLPCGLVYVACAGATATGGSLTGVVYMLVFGLGTVPMMFAIGVSGRLVHRAVGRWVARAVPISVAAVGLLLVVRGLGLGIPYLSPDLKSRSGAACCPVPASAGQSENAVPVRSAN